MKKSLRLEVYNKFNGLCAYTGKPLDDKWQVDHVKSRFRAFCDDTLSDNNCINNLMPACRIVNHYKRALDLEGFRDYMMKFHIRLSKLPKKTLVHETQKRKEYMFKVAELFGIRVDKPFNGIFYFETLSNNRTI